MVDTRSADRSIARNSTVINDIHAQNDTYSILSLEGRLKIEEFQGRKIGIKKDKIKRTLSLRYRCAFADLATIIPRTR
jgi:hypothetical protein